MTSFNANERLRLSEERARNWLSSIDPEDLDDLESVVDSIVDSSIRDSSDSESGEELALGTQRSFDQATNNLTSHHSDTEDDDDEQYNDISALPACQKLANLEQLLSRLPPPSFGNFSINNSTNVVLGNIIKIRGDLILNVKNDEENKKKDLSEKHPNDHVNNVQIDGVVPQKPELEFRTLIKKKAVYRPPCLIVPRRRWLAMDPVNNYNIVEEPTDLVIISHTATSSSTVQSENIGIIRDIQTFHIETRNWDDIGYNFLIGCDGNIYEGRGWGAEGSHTFKYNKMSIGISFVGCFMRKLPTPRALEACKNLLKLGVDEGHLSVNYKLMGHRQFTSTESPGSKLFEEIKKWDNFHDTPSEELNESDGE